MILAVIGWSRGSITIAEDGKQVFEPVSFVKGMFQPGSPFVLTVMTILNEAGMQD